MKKILLIGIAIILSIAIYYLFYPKYYFMRGRAIYIYRCNKITGEIKLVPIMPIKIKDDMTKLSDKDDITKLSDEELLKLERNMRRDLD